jgi:PAS domain S-box-containing protein
MSEKIDQSEQLRRKLELIVQTGLLLTRSSNLESIVQAATDAGRELCGAQFGAFFYNVVNAQGESNLRYTLSDIDRERFATSPLPSNFATFTPAFDATSIVRSPEIATDPRYGYSSPHHGMPFGHLPVRSYLAIPVKSQSGEVLGGLFFGHEDVDVFQDDCEDLLKTIAAQAAIAIENAQLRNNLTNKVKNLQQNQRDEREIAKHLGELAAIVESSDDAIITKDLNGIITSWNDAAARIFGYSADEIVGQSILKLIPPYLHQDEKTIIANIRAGRRIEHFETVRVTKTGQLLEVSLTVSPVKDHTGEIVGASKVLRDVSGKKRIEASLLQAEKIAATGRMAATIAHEINNPLEAVVNLLFLLRPMITNPDGIAYLDAAESELVRVAHIAKQTLGYYREHAAASAASISDLALNAITIYQPRCSAADICIENRIHPTTKITLRKGEMMQVISNLIANAIYAMPNGGTLRLTADDTTTPEPGVVLTIEDTGTGISPEHMPHIFEAFFTTRSTIGTGIGLFVAKQFIEGHGGKIRVTSSTDPITHGTAASIFLPYQTAYDPKPQSTEPLAAVR